MTKIRSVLAAALMISLGNSALGQSVNPLDLNLITFENRTTQNIEYLFVSPGDSAHWSTDILGSGRVLNAGDSRGFYIYYPDRCNEFDFMGMDSSGNSFSMYGYEICDGTEAVVPINNLPDKAPDLSLAEVRIGNATEYEIHYLFFAPADSVMWGVDQLDQDTILNPGDMITRMLPVTDSRVEYDVQAVDDETDTYTFQVQIDNSKNSHWVVVQSRYID
ncbi:MAG: hypothetical protein QNI99_17315 [Woeseiaceae bacterium]|nr:hypothetical protein [Woeseiaceae bacterium]